MVLSIQYLRGIAALFVVLSHVAWKGKQYSTDPLAFFRIGESGVDIFFVISGFIMCHTTAKAIGSSAESIRFMRNRVVRIVPLYWVLSALVLPVFWLFPEKVNSGGGVTEVVNSFLLIPTDNKYLIQAGWTLSYEFFFYAIFGLALLAGKRKGQAITLATLFALVFLGVSVKPESVFGRFVTDPMLAEFAFGILLYKLRVGGRMFRWLGLIGILISVIWLAALNFELIHIELRCFRFGIPAFLLCYGLLSFEDILLKKPIGSLKYLGDFSYSLYLIHPFPLAVLGLIWYKAIGNAWGGPFSLLLIFAALLAGALCYRFVESRLTQMLKPGQANPH